MSYTTAYNGYYKSQQPAANLLQPAAGSSGRHATLPTSYTSTNLNVNNYLNGYYSKPANNNYYSNSALVNSATQASFPVQQQLQQQQPSNQEFDADAAAKQISELELHLKQLKQLLANQQQQQPSTIEQSNDAVVEINSTTINDLTTINYTIKNNNNNYNSSKNINNNNDSNNTILTRRRNHSILNINKHFLQLHFTNYADPALDDKKEINTAERNSSSSGSSGIGSASGSSSNNSSSDSSKSRLFLFNIY